MRYVIVGNGVAGTTAAAAIRKNDPRGEIRMITEEAYPFYSRIRLMEYIGGEVDLPKLQINNQSWYDENKIQAFLNSRVADIDPAGREIVTQSGRRFPYDQLLLATGAVFLPPIQGADKKGVFTLRNIQDAEDQKLCPGKIKGAFDRRGNPGTGSRKQPTENGMNVSVAEFFPRLLPRQTDRFVPRCLRAVWTNGFGFLPGSGSKESWAGKSLPVWFSKTVARSPPIWSSFPPGSGPTWSWPKN